ncbi:hypothetical protein PAPYR_1389 [Paratrimastix pyriformis]|uniref:F-box domain-containing protein n=1 Tax=Paratrimastix pyriformis TaxID=342808 RepID=A0ABQ8UTN9_9EUKA|nr:hypothetical protein PAPYR_1389 [Paratrimastix pyriformis]
MSNLNELPPELINQIITASRLYSGYFYALMISLCRKTRSVLLGSPAQLVFSDWREPLDIRERATTPLPTADAIAALIGPCHELCELELSQYICFTNPDADRSEWADLAFSDHPNLRSFVCLRTGLPDNAVIRILGHIRASLVTLDLGWSLGATDPQGVLTAAGCCPHLEALTTFLDGSSAPGCYGALWPCAEQLTSLALQESEAEGLLEELLQQCRRLRCLRLMASTNHPTAAVTIPPALGATLEELHCGPRTFVSVLAHPAPFTGRLRKLNLLTGYPWGHADAFVFFLRANRASLEVLHLGNYPVPGTVLEALEAMPRLSELAVQTDPTAWKSQWHNLSRVLARCRRARLAIGSLQGSVPCPLVVQSGSLRSLEVVGGLAGPVTIEAAALERLVFSTPDCQAVCPLVLRTPALQHLAGLAGQFDLTGSEPLPSLAEIEGSAHSPGESRWLGQLPALCPRLRSLLGVSLSWPAPASSSLVAGELLPQITALQATLRDLPPGQPPAPLFQAGPRLGALLLTVWKPCPGPVTVCGAALGRLRLEVPDPVHVIDLTACPALTRLRVSTTAPDDLDIFGEGSPGEPLEEIRLAPRVGALSTLILERPVTRAALEGLLGRRARPPSTLRTKLVVEPQPPGEEGGEEAAPFFELF